MEFGKGGSVDTGLYKVWEYKPHWLVIQCFFPLAMCLNNDSGDTVVLSAWQLFAESFLFVLTIDLNDKINLHSSSALPLLTLTLTFTLVFHFEK